MTPAGIEPATFRFVAQLLNHCATAVPQQNVCKVLSCITNTAFKYLCNLAGTDYELPEDDAIASKHVSGSVIKSSIVNCWSFVHLLVHYTNKQIVMYAHALIFQCPTKDQIKHQLDATLCRFYFCGVTLHVSGVKRPSSGVLKKTGTAAPGTGVIVAGRSSHHHIPNMVMWSPTCNYNTYTRGRRASFF